MASIDVVVPCYNYGRFLRECVTSITSQEGVDLRVLIVDNASEDDSVEVARELAAEDSRIEVITRTVNTGATASYNEGIDWASSDYFLIVDADDFLVPGALARACAVMDENAEISFVHGVEARLEADGAVLAYGLEPGRPECSIVTGRQFVADLCCTPINRIGANTVVRRTSVQKRIGHYRKALPYTDDLEMWLRLATVGKVARLNTVQATRRYHASRMSTHYQSVQVRDFRERERAFESFFAHEGAILPDKDRLMAEARRGLGQHAYWSAVSHAVRRKWKIAAELLRFSHERRPNALLVPPLQWLAKMDRPLGRVRDVMADASNSLRSRATGH